MYHSGLTHDADYVIANCTERDGIREIVVAGYSLGGNLALKLAGEIGQRAHRLRRRVRRVAHHRPGTVRRALERAQNVVYQWNFVRNLKRACSGRSRRFPGRFARRRCARADGARFDEAYTAPHHGFRDAADYYHAASAMRVIDRIRVPTLILTAEDDPFVPPAPFRDPPRSPGIPASRRYHTAWRTLRIRRAHRRWNGANGKS